MENFSSTENKLKKIIAKEENAKNVVEAEKTIVENTKEKNSKIAQDITK